MNDLTTNQSSTPANDEPTEHRTLRELMADPATGGHPVIALAWSGHEAVVVDRVDDENVRIAPGPSASTAVISTAVAVRAITDGACRLEICRRAVLDVAADLTARTAELVRVHEQHRAALNQTDLIRQYAIDRHEDGQVCREGLDTFLSHFDLPAYQPRMRVRFTITGSYLVEDDQPDNAAREARHYLRVDFTNIDGFIDSDTMSVAADASAD